MDISKITDPKELKSLAYDQMVLLDQSQKNIQLIQQRIVQLEDEQLLKSEGTKDK